MPWLIAASLLPCCSVGTAATDADSAAEALLGQALKAYASAMDERDRDQRLQKFAVAEQLFAQIAQGSESRPPVRNAAIYLNLGNAALQADRLGPAILAYRRALLLDPAYSEARQNLDFARSRIPAWTRRQGTSELVDTLFVWRAFYSRRQILEFASLCFLLAAGLFSVGIVRRQAWWRQLAVVPLLMWLTLILSVGLGGNDEPGTEAVVTAQELTVHAADSENSPRRLSAPLPSGAEVKVLRQRDRWTEIELVGGRTGWVLASGLERVAERAQEAEQVRHRV